MQNDGTAPITSSDGHWVWDGTEWMPNTTTETPSPPVFPLPAAESPKRKRLGLKVTSGILGVLAITGIATAGGAPQDVASTTVPADETSAEEKAAADQAAADAEARADALREQEAADAALQAAAQAAEQEAAEAARQAAAEAEAARVAAAEANTPKAAPAAPAPAPIPAAAAAEPWNTPGPDLDCSDIGHPVTITGPDYHGLDRDGDGTGCDSA